MTRLPLTATITAKTGLNFSRISDLSRISMLQRQLDDSLAITG
jgi:hypothetical protein